MPIVRNIDLILGELYIAALLKQTLTDRQLEILVIYPLIMNVLGPVSGDKGKFAFILTVLGLRQHLDQGKTLTELGNTVAQGNGIGAIGRKDLILLRIALHFLDHARNCQTTGNSGSSTGCNTRNQTNHIVFSHFESPFCRLAAASIFL